MNTEFPTPTSLSRAEIAAISLQLRDPYDYLLHPLPSGNMELWYRSVIFNDVRYIPIRRDPDGGYRMTQAGQAHDYADEAALRRILTDAMGLYDVRRNDVLRMWVQAAPEPAVQLRRGQLVRDMREMFSSYQSALTLQVDVVQGLPPLWPVRLRKLHLIRCQSELPASLPDGLLKLTLSDCLGLTGLPHLPSGVLQLDISGVRSLSILGRLPDRLHFLRLSDAPALNVLPALPSSLVSLALSGCTALPLLPALPMQITRLVLVDCTALTTLPDLPANLQELDLSGCRSLIALPEVRPAFLRMLDLTGCIALPATLPDWVATVAVVSRNRPIEPAASPFEYWLRQGGKTAAEIAPLDADWTRVRASPGGSAFEAMLRRIAEPAVRAQIKHPAQVVEVIEEVLQSSQARHMIFAAARDADCDCHDRPLVRFNDIQIMARGSLLLRNGRDETALLELVRGAYRQSLLDETVMVVMRKQWGEPIDPRLPLSAANRRRQSNAAGDGPNVAEALEVQLALRHYLGRALNLPFAAGGLYIGIAALNIDDLKFALRHVGKRFADLGAMVDGVLAQPLWRQFLESRHADALARVSAQYEQEGQSLETRQASLAESERLTDQAYKDCYDDIGRRREAALNHVLRLKTEEALHYPAWAERLRTFSADYIPRVEHLRQRVLDYIAQHPGSTRVPGLQTFSVQLDITVQVLRASATLALADQVRLARKLTHLNPTLPTEARLASVPGTTVDEGFFAILSDLASLHQRRLSPPDDPWYQPSSLLQHLTQGELLNAPEQERLLGWDQVRHRIAVPFSEAGQSLGARVHHAPQGIWLGTVSERVQRGRCTGLALAWAFDPASTTLFDNVFAAAAHPAAPAVLAFGADIDSLHFQGAGEAMSRLADIVTWAQAQALTHLARQPGLRSLLIHVGNHSVALAAQGDGAEVRYAFYDPNAGAWLNIADADRMCRALDAHFTPALRALYVFNGDIRAFAVHAPATGRAVNAAWLRASSALRSDAGWMSMRPVPGRGLQAAVGPAGSGLRLYGAYSALSSSFWNFKDDNYREGAIDLASLVADGVGEGVERGSAHLGAFMSRSLKHALSGAANAGRNVGRLLSRGAGMLGNLLTLPFDLYSAVSRFQEAGQTEGLARQDALFHGSMATLGAAIGLGVAVTVAATSSASVVAVVGPLGLAVGAVMIATTQIYAAVRQVQEVEQWIALSGSERFRLGWRSFIGAGIDSTTELQVLEARYTQQVRQQRENDALRLLEAPTLGAVLYPNALIRFRLWRHTPDSTHTHQHVVERGASDILSEGGGTTEYLDAGRLQRVIKVRTGDARASYELFVEPGDDDIDGETGSSVAKNTTVVSSMQADHLPLMILAGNGNDRVAGARSRPNRIELGSGSKTVTGGGLDDVINLRPHPEWNDVSGNAVICRASHQLTTYRYALDGGAGNDSLQLSTRLAHTGLLGYRVDLALQAIDAIGEAGTLTPLGSVRHIENLYHLAGDGETGTENQLYGDDGANTLVGACRDRLLGRGGNDVLRVSGSASADGGDGDDVYLVGTLRQGDHVTLSDSGRGGVGQAVRLDADVESIRDWQIAEHDLLIRLHTGGRISVKGVYDNRNGQRHRRAEGWVFSTRDGFVLQPRLPDTPPGTRPENDWSIDARYVKDADMYHIAGQVFELDLSTRSLSAGDRRVRLDARYRLAGEGGGNGATVRGTAGEDMLRGGAENGTLIGNGGNDVFVIDAGTGEIAVDTGGSTSEAYNVLVLPVALDQVRLRIEGDDVLIGMTRAGATQTVRHRRGASGAADVAPLFAVDARDEQLHWSVDPESRRLTRAMRVDRLIERMALFTDAPEGGIASRANLSSPVGLLAGG
jgi:Ca2+-binding RTX toxin-like protein